MMLDALLVVLRVYLFCIYSSQYVASHPGQLSLAIPLWVGAVSTSQTEMTPCGWGVKAGRVRVWVAGKTM